MSCRRKCRLVAGGLVVIAVLVVATSYCLDREGTIFLIATIRDFFFTSESSVESFLEAVKLMQMSQNEKAALLDLIARFDRLCLSHNITYVAAFGTVLGFVRHGTVVPWDDDFDAMIAASQRNRLEQLFTSSVVKEHRFGLKLYKYSDYSYKVTRLKPTVRNRYAWGWPYIDIFLYDEYPEHVRVPMLAYLYVPKTYIFPVQRATFDISSVLQVNMPLCPWKVARQEFGDLNRCCTGKWFHRSEKAAPVLPRCITCRRLKGQFPFLRAKKFNASATHLEVRLGDRTLSRRVSAISLCGDAAA